MLGSFFRGHFPSYRTIPKRFEYLFGCCGNARESSWHTHLLLDRVLDGGAAAGNYFQPAYQPRPATEDLRKIKKQLFDIGVGREVEEGSKEINTRNQYWPMSIIRVVITSTTIQPDQQRPKSGHSWL